MNRLSPVKQSAILRSLTEGVSIRATARLAGVSKTTVLKLLVDAGQFCEVYQDHVLRDLPCTRIEADEIWAFVGAKRRRSYTPPPGQGDIWTFTALCCDSKLMVSSLVGHRTQEFFDVFMQDVASRLAQRIQLTTDGHPAYPSAVERAFGWNGVDYATLVKKYAHDESGRYSPGKCIGTEKTWVMGNPDERLISTSYVERQNLTMRLNLWRFTRLTNAFSRKVENHAYAVALHFFAYNFTRPHQTVTAAAKGVKTTPAMAAGVTNRVWLVDELVDLMDPRRLLQ